MSLLEEREAGAVPDRTELVRRARELGPRLAANAAEAERARRIPEDSIDAVVEAGLFRITVPRRFGGYEVDLQTKLEVSAALAEGDGSTAWVVTLVNVCSWLAGLFPDRAQQDVFGEDPGTRICGVLAPTAESTRADGGLLVSGRWPYASGCLHSSWAVLGLPVVDDRGEPIDQGLALVPLAELTVEETWFVAGMRGTGSNTIVAENVFVPDHRILSVVRAVGGEYATEHVDEALYRSAFVPVLALVLAGPQVGLAQAALDYVIEKAPRRSIAYTSFERQSDSTAFQTTLADAAMLVDTARLHVARAAADIDGAAARGEKLGYLARARVRADTAWAIRQAREAIDLLVSAHGASSFAESSPLQRIWRDSSVAGRHAVVLPDVNSELYGKALLGIEENITPLV
jgi:alkylation response protein AidB-like acyl-CoA dehydrogenase